MAVAGWSGSAHAGDGYRLVRIFAGSPGGLYPGSLVGHQTGGPETWALYGMTLEGGVTNKADCGQLGGRGIVYRLSPPPVRDASGVLFGTALYGPSLDGAVFSLTPPAAGQTAWTPAILHAFSGADSTSFIGGASDLGTAFKILQ